jgi:Xaa-Pro aminopeptidase
MRERIRELKLTDWFFPSVTIQRYDEAGNEVISYRNDEEVIQYGDLLWCDFGITYLRLNTDTQENAYVLRPGETDVPDHFKRALATGNRLQDILLENYAEGRSGNDILLGALDQMKKEGIDGTIYTHPIGYHGHGAGPTIGLSEKQEFISGAAEWPLRMNTAYSIELNAKVPIAEWGGQKVRIALEEEAIFTPEGIRFIDGRAKEWILIPRRNSHLGK